VGAGALIVFLLFALALFTGLQQASGIPTSATGSDFNLYGKTLDNEDFDWESLRGKHVLVKFTATWCGPCQGEIPGMLDAYKKYHDKGLEIVSVYIWQGNDHDSAVSTVKKYVEKEKLPWIIISESLTEKAGQPPQGKTFGIQGVPTMLLVNKEGKVHATNTRGTTLQRELKKVFEK
jgi:thiol-disulfide isomerase/thioredoxin